MSNGAFKASQKFFHAATKSLRSHHKLATAIGAGATAVLGHGVIAAGVVAAAPFALGAAAVGGAVFGTVKLVEHLREKA